MDSIVYTSCQTRVSNHSSYVSVEKFSNEYNAFYFLMETIVYQENSIFWLNVFCKYVLCSLISLHVGNK